MGARYYWDRKNTVESSLSIDLKRLREWGYFRGLVGGTLTWTNGWGKESSIGITVSTSDFNNAFTRLNYTVTEKSNGETRDFDYRVKMVFTPCNYGGKRWWFICGLSIDGKYCGRRVYKLYSSPGSNYFGCRHCHDLSYKARQEHSRRFDFLQRFFSAEKRVEKMASTVKRRYYAGKPTKKYRQLLKYQRIHAFSSLDAIDWSMNFRSKNS